MRSYRYIGYRSALTKLALELPPGMAKALLEGGAGGAISGGVAGGLSAPDDHGLEGAARGALVGGLIGAGARGLVHHQHPELSQQMQGVSRGMHEGKLDLKAMLAAPEHTEYDRFIAKNMGAGLAPLPAGLAAGYTTPSDEKR